MVMSLATGEDVDVMGVFDGKNLECGWRRLYRRMATTKIQKSAKKKHQFDKMPTSEIGGGAATAMNVLVLLGNDYVISRSRLKLRRSIFANDSQRNLGGGNLGSQKRFKMRLAEMSFRECPCVR